MRGLSILFLRNFVSFKVYSYPNQKSKYIWLSESHQYFASSCAFLHSHKGNFVSMNTYQGEGSKMRSLKLTNIMSFDICNMVQLKDGMGSKKD